MADSLKTIDDCAMALIDALFQAEIEHRNKRGTAALNDSALVAVALALLEQASPLPQRDRTGSDKQSRVLPFVRPQPRTGDRSEAAAEI